VDVVIAGRQQPLAVTIMGSRVDGGRGRQRARVRAVALRCEQLVDAAMVAEQLSFNADRERRLRAEQAVDALNRRFGSGTVGPAATYLQAG
jgi:DNA polymerase-4